jgi:hypothetical protein
MEVLMRRYAGMIAVAVLAVASALSSVACNDALDGVEVFTSDLAGANEVPARGTAASGRAGYNVQGDVVTYTIEVHGITNITGAHIHAGAQGVNGRIRIAHFPRPGTNFLPTGTSTSSVDGILVEGGFRASEVTGITYQQLLAEMRAGTCYTNVHTTQFPGGEIRGQVRAVALD